jgi:RHS repeat-associated protein
MSYATYTIQTAFGCSGISEYSATNVSLVDRITLPDNTFYQFSYEYTPGSTTTVTGRLASVTFPTGATISYQYSGGGTGVNGITCADGSAAILTRIVPDGTWTYTRTMGSGAASATKVTAPKLSYDAVGNDTIVQFQRIYETQRNVYQGSAPAISSLPIPESTLLTANMLQETQTCYNASASPCTTTAVTLPITQRAVAVQFGSTGLQARHVMLYNSSGLPTEADDYDYGSAVPLKKVLTTYATLGNGIIGMPASVTIQDGAGNPKAQTTYAYDETAVVAPPNQPTPQHTSVTGSRGNVTTINYPVSGLSAHFTYYDTGSVQTVTDVNGAVTTYNYGALTATCGNTFPTGVAEPLNMSKSYTWNCTGGVKTQSTDENGKTTTASYTDAYFWRPFSVTDPTSAVTNLAYTAPTVSSPASIESSLLFNSNNSTVDVLTTSDGLGRTHLRQTRQAPGSSSFDSVETDYDAIGRPTRVTMPYQAASGQTTSTSAPGVKTTYDGLGRVLSVTDGGNSTTTFAYNQNDVLVTVGPAPTGEDVKKRQLEYDALGRLTSVCEVTSLLPGYGSCAQATAQTGYWTRYIYDTLGNVLSVTQNAQATSTNRQTRSYTYDAMSRLTSETNPEMAQASIAYTYDLDTSGTCTGTYRSNLIKRVDPKGNTTCYAYDLLHRATSITYSGPDAPNTPNKYFVYDAATISTIPATTVQNAKTRLAEAYTATSQAGTKITDLGFSYTARGEVSDVYQSTPHSNGYYHVPASYFANGALNQLNTLSGGLPSLPGLPTFSYAVDGEGRISAVSAGSGQNPVSNVSYSLYGSPPQLQVTFGSGDSDTYSYDAGTGRMTQYKFTVGSPAQSVVGNLTWNQNGSLQQHQISDPFNSANTQTCAYQHDDVSRIGSVDCGTGGWGQSFAYDAFSNITKNVLQNHTGNSFQPAYQTSPSITNRIATLPGNITVNYDANGNTLNDGSYTYTWDVESRPATISTSSTVTLTFDSLGRAVEQLKNAAYTQILYGPTGEKLALMSGQTLQRAFVALPAGASAVYTASGLDHYQHTDWLGSARLTSTPTRTVSGDTAYAPFGETYAQSGAPDLSFTGQNQDTAGGLYDFLYREFSTQGRWHSPDPAGLAAVSFDDPQSLNRYAYARNMPTTLTDPLGLCPECRYAPASSSFQAPTCYLEGVQISCTLLARINDAGASYLVFPGYKYKGTLDSGTNCYVGVVVDDAFCLGDHSTFSFRDNSNSSAGGGSGGGGAQRPVTPPVANSCVTEATNAAASYWAKAKTPPSTGDILGGGIISGIARIARASNPVAVILGFANVFRSQIGNAVLADLAYNATYNSCSARNGLPIPPF